MNLYILAFPDEVINKDVSNALDKRNIPFRTRLLKDGKAIYLISSKYKKRFVYNGSIAYLGNISIRAFKYKSFNKYFEHTLLKESWVVSE